jgi:DNA-binding CsgD family transcriptional regulator
MDADNNASALQTMTHKFVIESVRYKDMQALSDAVLAVIASFGMTAAASGMVSGPKITTPDLFHFTSWPADWINLYMAREFYLIDPVPRWARKSGRPITWKLLFKVLPKRDPGRAVISAGAPFGFTEGIVVPTRAADGNLGAVCFGGDRGALSAIEQIALVLIARCAFEAADRIKSNGAKGEAAPILTAREIECLTFLVRGHDDKQIARLTRLSVRTVRFHMTNARQKLGANSRIHLAAIAMAEGFVTI